MARRKLKLHQVFPDQTAESRVLVVEAKKDDNYWLVRITDAMSGDVVSDRPYFRGHIAKRGPRHTLHEVAVRGAEECQGGRGLVQVTRYQDGIPVELGVFISTGRYVWQVTPDSLGRLRRVRELVAAGHTLHAAAARILQDDGKPPE